MANWYAIYTRSGCEKKVTEILTRKNIENYCPLVRSVRKLNEGKKAYLEPLFCSYVYVRMKEGDLYKLKSISRIVNVVYWLQRPVVIKDIEIEMIRRFVNEHDTIRLEKSEIKLNEIVKVVKGPTMEREGSEVSESYNEVKLILPSIGYSLIATVENERDESTVEIIMNQKSYSGFIHE